MAHLFKNIIHGTEKKKDLPKFENSFSSKDYIFDDLTISSFQQWDFCNVTLYQDAHVGDGSFFGGKTHHNCFEDIYNAIVEAKAFIFITGWSVDASKTLLRQPPGKYSEAISTKVPSTVKTIGELLKWKAEKGVDVYVAIWDDPLSVTIGKEHTDGSMHTSDEASFSYFKGTKVKIVKMLRLGTKGEGDALVFTHHQKTVIVDANLSPHAFENKGAANENVVPKEQHKKFFTVFYDRKAADGAKKQKPKRRIIAFLGGLDLTGGRWDNQNHSLYRTLQTEHLHDFYNGWDIEEKYGPRQPWHDIHSRIEGPAARDVLTNFVERWKKQGKDYKDDIDSVINKINSEMFISTNEEKLTYLSYPWTIQIQRSITIESAINLKTKIENSIQRTMVSMIRKANKFIYVENQYFMGSAKYWEKSIIENECKNLVPYEVT